MAYDIPEGFEEVKASSGIPEGFEEVDNSHHIEVVDGLPTYVKGKATSAPKASLADKAIGIGEAGIGTISGLMNMPVDMLQAFTNSVTGGTGKEMPHSPIAFEPQTEKGQEYSDVAGDIMNRYLIPMAPVANIPMSRGQLKARELENMKAKGRAAMEQEFQGPATPEGWKAPKAPIPEGFEEVGPPRPPLSVTPEGLAFDPRTADPGFDLARQQAAERQRTAQLEQPLDLTDPYRNQVEEFPQVLQEPRTTGGLDMTEFNADRMSKDLQRDIENPLLRPEEASFEGEGGGGAISSYSKSNPAAAYWEQRQRKIMGPRGQRGAISADAVKDAIDLYKRGMASGHKVIEAFKGAFKADEMEFMQRAIENPGNRNAVVLMSPDEFHSLAASRSPEYMANTSRAFGPENHRQSIREGLKSHEGLNEIPTLLTRTQGDTAQVFGHEGRHRMDVFKEMGIDLVPVMIRDAKEPWGKAKKLIGEEEYEIPNIAERKAQSFPPILNNTLRGPRSQRGALSPQLIKDLETGLKKIGETMEKLGGRKVSPYTDKERVVLDAVGDRTYIPKGEDPKGIIEKALAEGKDGEHLFQNMQSGLTNASEKVKSAAMLGTARWLNYGKKMGDRLFRLNARPVEQEFARLSEKDLIAAMDQMREDMFARAEGDTSHLSPKAQKALAMLRKAHERALQATNESLLALGKEPIKPQDAYMASMWAGNYHVPIFDKAGKLQWYLKLETKAEAKQALEFLRKDPVGENLNLDEAKIAYHPVNVGSRVPRDVMGAYQDMLQFFDGETAAQMKLAMEQYTQEKGYTFQQHQKHFENKANVRGFMGDRPWLSPKENAKAQAKAQFNYLREAFEWAPMQESLAAIKEVLASPELNKLQPNNMEMIKNYVSQQMGVSKNMFRAFEQATQKMLTDLPAPLVKVVPHSIARFVHSSKTLTYLQQLGMSAGYAIATPLQAFILGPSWHLKMTGEGFKHNVFKTASQALYDFSLGILGHETKSTFGHGFDMPMSPLGKEAFKYMEDNGIIAQNIFHENSGFGDYPPLHVAKSLIGWTISMPEKLARASTFMSFVHHLDASGKFKTQAELFRMAEEVTNHVLTDFNREARPLVVDKLGQTGELAYTYKSAIFNQWNNLGIFARDAKNGKPGALLAALFMTGLLGGTSGLPGINEVDGLWNVTKEVASKAFPTLYPKISSWDVKGSMLRNMAEFSANKKVQDAIGAGPAKFIGDTVNYGLPSAVTGSQLASRFSSSVADVSNLTGNIAPAFQEIAQVAKAGADAMSNTSTGYASAAWKMLPPALQGILENNVDNFKTVKQGKRQGYANPNKLDEHQTTYARTPEEEFKRNFGLRSLDEATTKSDRFITNQETARLKQAQDASMKSMFDAIVRKDKEDIKKYARAYFDNDGAERFEGDLNKKIEEYTYTPEQRAMIKAQSILALKSVRRFRQLHLGK